jgi:phosphoribosyl-ATP pyrophosphohydrolase
VQWKGSETVTTPTVPLDLGWLRDVLAARRGADPAASYTARLLAEGPDRIGRKIGEEAAETIIAGMRLHHAGAPPAELVGEAADLVYHLMVFLLALGVDPAEVIAELHRRHRS